MDDTTELGKLIHSGSRMYTFSRIHNILMIPSGDWN